MLDLLPLPIFQLLGQFPGEKPRRQPFLLRKPQERLVQEAEKGTAEHAGQTHLVARAIDRPQQVQQIVDFLLGVEGVSADEVIVDAVAPQGIFVIFHVRQGAKQQGDVALLDWPDRRPAGLGRLFVPDHLFPGVEHGADAAGDPIGFAPAEPLARCHVVAGFRSPLPLGDGFFWSPLPLGEGSCEAPLPLGEGWRGPLPARVPPPSPWSSPGGKGELSHAQRNSTAGVGLTCGRCDRSGS